MNKTILIAGGASAVSLAVGGAGGYLYAKKKLNARLDALIDEEVAKTKKVYSILLMQAKNGKPESPVSLVEKDEDEALELEAEDPPQPELSPADKKTIQRGRKALVDYQGFAVKPEVVGVVESNIFTDSPKKTLPPRGPGGKFLPRTDAEEAEENEPQREPTPYMIEPDVFLENEPDHDQESALYFANDDTVVLVSDPTDEIEIPRVGEVNLTLFPDDEPSVIYVRNEGLQIDYQITRTFESLTAFMGLGEEDEAVDMEAVDSRQEELDHEYANQD